MLSEVILCTCVDVENRNAEFPFFPRFIGSETRATDSGFMTNTRIVHRILIHIISLSESQRLKVAISKLRMSSLLKSLRATETEREKKIFSVDQTSSMWEKNQENDRASDVSCPILSLILGMQEQQKDSQSYGMTDNGPMH